MKYKINDEIYISKEKAISRRMALNKFIKEAGDINITNKVLKYGNKFIVRPYTKRHSNII